MSITDEVFTSALLERVLENHLKTPSKVINVEIVKMLEPGENFCGKMLRIFVTYVIKNRGSNHVLSMIAKCPLIDKGITTLLVEELNMLERESRFYEEVLPKMREIGVKKDFGPKLYYSLSTPSMILFLEDLSAMGYDVKSRHEGLDLEHCLVALDKLAYFHGLSVVVHKKSPEIFNTFKDKGLLYNNKAIEENFSITYKELLEICQKIEGFQQYHKKLVRIENIRERIYNATKPSETFNVLNHGDFWCNNLMFKYHSDGRVEDVIFVDYQLSYFASPFVDLHYFLSATINLQVKEKHMTTIFNYYIDKLILYLKELNVSERPTRNELLDDFKKRAIIGFFTCCCVTCLFKAPKRSDGNLNNFIKNNGPNSFRYACFNNQIYIKELEYLLPFYDSLGAFD